MKIIRLNGVSKNLGGFNTAEEASIAYQNAIPKDKKDFEPCVLL